MVYFRFNWTQLHWLIFSSIFVTSVNSNSATSHGHPVEREAEGSRRMGSKRKSPNTLILLPCYTYVPSITISFHEKKKNPQPMSSLETHGKMVSSHYTWHRVIVVQCVGEQRSSSKKGPVEIWGEAWQGEFHPSFHEQKWGGWKQNMGDSSV